MSKSLRYQVSAICRNYDEKPNWSSVICPVFSPFSVSTRRRSRKNEEFVEKRPPKLRPIFCQKPTHGVNTARANPLPEIVPTRRVGTHHTAKSIDFSLRSVFETTRFALLARRAERYFFSIQFSPAAIHRFGRNNNRFCRSIFAAASLFAAPVVNSIAHRTAQYCYIIKRRTRMQYVMRTYIHIYIRTRVHCNP